MFPSAYKHSRASTGSEARLKRYQRIESRRDAWNVESEQASLADERCDTSLVVPTLPMLSLTEDSGMEVAAQLLLLLSRQDKATQTVDTENIDEVLKENGSLKRRVFGVVNIQGNDVATKFYKGLPCWGMFLHVFMFLSPFVVRSNISVSLDDEYFAV